MTMHHEIRRVGIFVLSFILCLTLLQNVCKANVINTHPRILLTDEVLVRLNQKVAGNVPEWQELKSQADNFLSRTLTTSGEQYAAIHILGLTY